MGNLKKLCCLAICLACSLGFVSLTACTMPWENQVESSSKESSKQSDSESESISESTSNSASSSTEDSSSSQEENKIVKTETDDFGHEIVYYQDGTWIDNGRVVPLDFSTQPLINQYAYNALSEEENGANLCALYADLYEMAVEFSSSWQDVEKVEESYPIFTYDYTEYGLTPGENIIVWKSFVRENPAFYWIAREAKVVATEMTVAVEEEYALSSVREEIDEAIQQMALDCDLYLNGKMNDTERLLTIYDYVVSKIEYAYEEDGTTPEDEIWAHNIVGAATKNKGVCETYASTMEYLCDLFGYPCITVEGDSTVRNKTEAHAWNYIQIEDEWYAFDVTWGDMGKYVDRQWFAMEKTEFAKTHTPNTAEPDWDIARRFDLPTLSKKIVCPVVFVDENGSEETLLFMEKAIEKMTNEGGRYEVKLYPTTKLCSETFMINPVGATWNVRLPKVEELTISGDILDFGNTFYKLSSLTVKGEQTLSSNIVLKDMYVHFEDLNFGSYALIAKGRVNVSSSQFLRGSYDAKIIVEKNAIMDISEADIENVEIGISGSLELNGNAHFGKVWMDSSGSVNAYSKVDFTIDNVYLTESVAIIRMWAKGAEQRFEIGNVYLENERWKPEAHVKVIVDSIEDADKYPELYFTGESEVKVELCIEGRSSYVVTDPSGNIVNRFEEYVDPLDVACPIANVSKIDFSLFEIIFIEWRVIDDNDGKAGFDVEKTYMYELTEDGDIVLKEEYQKKEETGTQET
ncbi:MAG: hypothetical protein IJX75_04720 [Clostridia bacterium]|nr:hypothetical protein [Clostridia bacterium]